ncbi:MAG: hypothetical protein ACYSWU_12200 [Planctomycetota bacterium]|jgi:hypothetical protein
MGVVGGCDAAIDVGSVAVLVPEWRVNYTGKLRPYTASGLSAGMAVTQTAVKDFTGFYRAFGHTPTIFPGDIFQLKASIDASVGVASAASGCICDSIIVRGSVEQGGPIEQIVRFSGNGALTYGVAVAVDSGTPDPGDATDMRVSIGTTVGDVDVDETDCRDVVMEISCRNKPYSSSATPGVVKRTRGALNARVMWRRYEDTPSDFGSNQAGMEDNDIVNVWVTSTTYWELTNMQIAELPDFYAQHETEENVGITLMAVLDASKAGTAVGTIKNPAAATKWPFA